MKPTNEEIAWAAGVFEGEGCFILVKRKGREIQRGARITLGSTDLDVLQKFADIMGVGKISPPRQNYSEITGRPHKLIWYWNVSSAPDVIVVINLLRPWLGKRRRERAEELLPAAWAVVGRTLLRRAKVKKDKPAAFYQIPEDTMRMLGRCLGEDIDKIPDFVWPSREALNG